MATGPLTLQQKATQTTDGFRCLILEDDPSLAEVLAQAVSTAGGKPSVAGTVERASALVAHEDFEVCVLDHVLPDGKGSAFYSSLREKGVLTPCIMLTAAPEVKIAVELTRNGLFDYLAKPVPLHRLLECMERAVAHSVASQSSLQGFGLGDSSSSMNVVRQRVHQAAANPRATVLLMGETGVGKDLIARLIHQLTFQKQENPPPLVSLNCSTLPADMFEAELFGAAKGAYTGAHENRIGLAEAAQGGTLFLDEIAEVAPFLQAKLLQFLETREYRRLGHAATKRFDGRIIAATNKSLETEVQAGRFRADLWYRLDVFNIFIPPLRQRKEDVTFLAEYFLDSLCQKHERPRPIPKPEDLAALHAYDFPGNVRELRNIIERSLLQTPADAKWLQLDRTCFHRTSSAPPKDIATVAPRASARKLSPIEEPEYELIRKTLADEGGLIRRAAAKLGMSHQALLRRLNKWPELRGN